VPPETRGDVHQPLVLLVDDIESARIVGERRLRHAGYRVIPVANELAALEALIQARDVSLIVADWNLGPKGGNGLDLLVTIGKRRRDVARILWCGDPTGCDLAAELGIRCVEKDGLWSELLTAIAEELGARHG